MFFYFPYGIRSGQNGDTQEVKKADAPKKEPECHRLSDGIINPQVGDTVVGGRYRHAPLRWKVLAVRNGKALLLSDTILTTSRITAAAAGADAAEPNDYAALSHRLWYRQLAEDFTARERERIVPATVAYAKAAPDANETAGGEEGAIKDLLFSLSVSETVKYLPKEKDRIAPAARFPGEEAGVRCWWLRTTAKDDGVSMLCVDDGGEIAEEPTSRSFGLRPAMWVRTS